MSNTINIEINIEINNKINEHENEIDRGEEIRKLNKSLSLMFREPVLISIHILNRGYIKLFRSLYEQEQFKLKLDFLPDTIYPLHKDDFIIFEGNHIFENVALFIDTKSNEEELIQSIVKINQENKNDVNNISDTDTTNTKINIVDFSKLNNHHNNTFDLKQLNQLKDARKNLFIISYDNFHFIPSRLQALIDSFIFTKIKLPNHQIIFEKAKEISTKFNIELKEYLKIFFALCDVDSFIDSNLYFIMKNNISPQTPQIYWKEKEK
jgi:hypothetical protein